MQQSFSAFAKDLQDLVNSINQIPEDKDHGIDPRTELLSQQLQSASATLGNNPNFPRISELTLIDTLLNLSASNADKAVVKLDSTLQADLSEMGKRDIQSKGLSGVERGKLFILIHLYNGIKKVENDLTNANPVKGAKDCLAPVVEAQP